MAKLEAKGDVEGIAKLAATLDQINADDRGRPERTRWMTYPQPSGYPQRASLAFATHA